MKKPAPSLRARIVEQVLRQPGLGNSLRARRRLLDSLAGREPELELYYELGDGHSQLCAAILPRIEQAVRCDIRINLTAAPPPELFPEETDQRAFALADAQRIAGAWGLPQPALQEFPDSELLMLGNRILLKALRQGSEAFLQLEPQVCELLAGGDLSAMQHLLDQQGGTSVRATQEALDEAALRRRRLGHYLPAMWHFDGSWFWALDRFEDMNDLLSARQLLRGTDLGIERDDAGAILPSLPKPLPDLEFFFSFRSPYSYLALECLKRAARDLPVTLLVRPVLPMVMRGLPVPRVKRMYIARDARRIAQRLRIPFGRIADPVGAGAERCLAVFPLATGVEQQLDFLASAARGIWSEGIDVATDDGLRYVVERAGMKWADAVSLIAAHDLGYAERNRQDMREAGLWGVPSFRIGEFATWGQDRLWLVEELLRRS